MLLKKAAAKAPVVLGGDFNASIGSICCDRVGDCDPEDEDDAGSLLHELARCCHAWFPATWDQCHSGQSWTYVQKRNQALTRPDMVCLPDCWREAKVSSWVDPSLHVGQPYIDHLAAVVRIHARIKVGKGSNRRNLVRIDAAALTDPVNQPHLQRILSAAPRVPWNVTADAHAALLVGYLQKELSETFAPAEGRPKQTYISDETWALHGQVATLRKRCARLRRHCRVHLLAAAFQAWAARNADILHTALCSQWAFQAASWGQAQSTQLRSLAQSLRQACKQDRAKYLSTLADEVQDNRPGSHQALNKLLGLRRKKAIFSGRFSQKFSMNEVTSARPPRKPSSGGGDILGKWRQASSNLRRAFSPIRSPGTILTGRHPLMFLFCQDPAQYPGPWLRSKATKPAALMEFRANFSRLPRL